mgnify:CR=1 FL=1
MHRSRNIRRPGFTMIELLVVIAIIGVLAGLAIYFVPSFNTSAKSARGAGDLQQWLITARQRAIRDQSPRGLRLLMNNNPSHPNFGYYDRAQYLELPDDLGAGRIFDSANSWANLVLMPDPANPTNPRYVKVAALALVMGTWQVVRGPNFTDGSCQIGDYLEVNGGNLVHYIRNITFSNPMKPTVFDKLDLASPLPNAITTPIKETIFMVVPV